MVQAHILYSGTVQGVGFRYTARRYAANLGLTGWVKNLPSGQVEVIVEGLKKDIDDFCKKMDSHFPGYINDKQISIKDTLSEFADFKITG